LLSAPPLGTAILKKKKKTISDSPRQQRGATLHFDALLVIRFSLQKKKKALTTAAAINPLVERLLSHGVATTVTVEKEKTKESCVFACVAHR
jgi:hypothetical protein